MYNVYIMIVTVFLCVCLCVYISIASVLSLVPGHLCCHSSHASSSRNKTSVSLSTAARLLQTTVDVWTVEPP